MTDRLRDAHGLPTLAPSAPRRRRSDTSPQRAPQTSSPADRSAQTHPISLLVAKNEEPKLAESTPLPATPIATPPAIAVATPQPATPAPRLAPEGIFYLIVAVNVETKDGIVGLPPGTGVKLVRPGVYLTPQGEMSLTSAQLTNDMDVAREARDTDHARQGALQKRLADEAAATRHPRLRRIQAVQQAHSTGPPADSIKRMTLPRTRRELMLKE